jgi:arabinofuranan 3-O-arabinosyltransferase
MADLIKRDPIAVWAGHASLQVSMPASLAGREAVARARTVIGGLEDRIFVPRRLYGFGLAFLLSYGVIFLLHIWLRDWPMTASGAPIFIDFISFWINARFALTAAAGEAYDYVAFAAAQAPYVAVTRGAFPYFHLVYPPTLFPVIAAFGLLPYLAALIAWIASTASLYLFAIHRIVPHALACVLALVPIAVAKNIWLGQTGFLVAGLLGLVLGLMAKRPFLAGMCLGLLTCKPQYGLIFPIVLVVTGQWRMIAGACLTVAVLALAITGFYGAAIWLDYARAFGTSSLDNFMTDDVLDAIDQTVFGVLHWFGAGFAAKWSVHLIAAVVTTAVVCFICRRPVSESLKAAALGIGALIATPYMLAYDLACLTVPVAFLAQEGLRTGFLAGERLTFLGCFLALFLMQQIPVASLILAALMIVLLRRALTLTIPASPDHPAALLKRSLLEHTGDSGDRRDILSGGRG